LAVASPILFGLVTSGAIRAFRSREPRAVLLSAAAVTPLLFFAVAAMLLHVHANWPVPAYLSGVALLSLPGPAATVSRWFWPGCALAFLSLLLILINGAMPLVPPQVLQLPPARGHAGPVMAAHVGAVLEESARRGARVWVAANRYQDASQLAFYLP